MNLLKELEEVPKLIIDNSYVLCPDCKTKINVGKVGIQNYYKRHKGSAQCAANKKKKKIEDAIEKTKQNASRFFHPQAPAVPSTVKVPTLVQSYIYPPSLSTTLASPLEGYFSCGPSRVPIKASCPIGVKLLQKLRSWIESLPLDVDVADESHPLAAFAKDPEGCVTDGEDAWEKFDGQLNTLLQKPPEELQYLVRVGQYGLMGLCRLLEYLVISHDVSGVLLEGKVGRLMRAIDEV